MLLHERVAARRLILASASPRRRQLMEEAGMRFELAPKFECDESYPATLPAAEVAAFLSALKSNAYPEALSDEDILITADTTVVVDDRVLGKPSDREEAYEMLRAMSGRGHRVYTGVTLRSKSKVQTFSVESEVYFREMDDEEIFYYIDNYRPYDKAGAYGIQEWIGYVAIERIEGSFYNVMGLPIQRLYKELLAFIG
ncbi:MAG: septum formation protein Maf [Alistipes sp.]|nr:septum formation protein Maf [Alistipes sp.]